MEDRRVKGHLRKGHLRKEARRARVEGSKRRIGWQAIALWLWSRMSQLRGALQGDRQLVSASQGVFCVGLRILLIASLCPLVTKRIIQIITDLYFSSVIGWFID